MPHDCPPYTAARQRLRTSSRALHGQAVERRCRRRRGVVPSPFAQGLGCTSVRNDRLGSLPTRDRKLSREHGPATSATSHRRRRRIVRSQRAARTGSGSDLGGRRLVLRRPNQSARCTFWLECRSRQMAVFCAVSANNCSRGAPIGFPTSTSTFPRLLRAQGRCLGPSKRPYAPQTRLLEQ